jgi:NAD(P) transhydrogenase subunit alpha
MDFVSILSIFVLACFVGYYRRLVGDAGAAHAADGVTNAISSVIIVGALIASAASSGATGRAWPSGWGWAPWCWPASTSSAASR